jgi:hypothetical protein
MKKNYLGVPQEREHELVRVDDAGGRGEERLFPSIYTYIRVWICLFIRVCLKVTHIC